MRKRSRPILASEVTFLTRVCRRCSRSSQTLTHLYRLECLNGRGATRADFLVSLDAQLRVVDDGGVTVLDEPGFPVVELARSSLIWLGDSERRDFEFDGRAAA